MAMFGRKRRLLSVRPERSRRVCAGAVIRLRSARTGGGAALRLGGVRARRLFNPSPAEAGVQLGDRRDGGCASLFWLSRLAPGFRRGGGFPRRRLAGFAPPRPLP